MFLDDLVYDNGFSELVAITGAADLHLCSAQPTDAAEAVSLSLLVVTGVTIDAINDEAGDRGVNIPANPGIAATGTGTATYWALVRQATPRLMAAMTITPNVSLTSGLNYDIPAVRLSGGKPPVAS